MPMLDEKGQAVTKVVDGKTVFETEYKDDALASWCGIFVVWALKTAGVPVGNWVGTLGKILKKAGNADGKYMPKPGDVTYRPAFQHMGFVLHVEQKPDAGPDGLKPSAVKNLLITTVDGNTAGDDFNGGKISINTRSLSTYSEFYTY